MRMLITPIVLAAIAVTSRAHAQQAPPNVWTKFETTAPHANVAGVGCGLHANAIIDGRTVPILLVATEDGAELCTSGQDQVDAVHGRLKMTRDITRKPSEVIVEIDVPANATPQAQNDLRSVLVKMAADLQQRAGVGAPVIVETQPAVTHTPDVPMHRVSVVNTPVIVGGAAGFAAGYLIAALVGLAILPAAGDPGTGRFWPFVPFIGVVAFAGSYKEAANCDCDAGRFFSVLGGILIDGVQLAGAIVAIVGVAIPSSKMVPDKVSIRLGPTGAMIEGHF